MVAVEHDGKIGSNGSIQKAMKKPDGGLSQEEVLLKIKEALIISKPLEGKVALVTGSATENGIGYATASLLGLAGAHLVLTGHPEFDKETIIGANKKMNKTGAPYINIMADVSDPDQAEMLVRETVNHWGRLDILVNNAGITRDRTLKKMSHQEWNEVISVNLTSLFNITHHAIQIMIEQGYGRIVNISSVVGEMGNIGQANYAAAKAGILGFTKSAARELARYNINVNAICPGFTQTRMTEDMPPEALEKVKSIIPQGRLGKPEDIASGVFYLVTPGGDYVTGQELNINGGLYM